MNRSVSLTLTAEDYVAAHQLHQRDCFRRRGTRLTLLGYVIVLTIVFLTMAYLGHWMFGAILVSLAAAASVAYGFAAYFLLVPFLARRAYRKHKALHHPYTYSWAEAGLTIANVGGQWCLPWSDYLKWREDARVFMFYQAPSLFNMLPKRVLTPEQVPDIRQYADRIVE